VSDNFDTIRHDRDALRQELESAGAKFKGSAILCPFHEDKHPSAGIYERDGIWRFKCQSCGVAGDVFDIRARRTGKPLAEILLSALGQTESQNRPAQKRSRSSQAGNDSKIYPDLDSLRDALPGQVTSEHPYVNPDTGQADLIVFRCQVNGDKSYRPAYPVKNGFRLAAPPKPWPLYARDAIANSDTVIIVEGEKCADVLASYSIASTTNPFGAGKAEHCDWIPLAGKNVVLWPDFDVTGHNHMRQVQIILEGIEPKPRIAWLEPNVLDLAEKEDVADFIEQLKTIGKSQTEITAELHRVIAKAKPLGPLDKLHRRIDAIVSGDYRLVHWPWLVLTSLSMALLPGTVTLLAGTVGASKSFMLLQAILFWLAESETISYYALEGDRIFHLSRALAQLTGVASHTDPEWIACNSQVIRSSISEHSQELERLSHHLSTSENLGNAENLEQLAEWIQTQAKHCRRLIAVDPITAAGRTSKPWISDLAFLKSAKKTAIDYGCSIVLVTHPTKGVLEPTKENLAGSAAYERFTDAIITLQNHEPKESRVKTDCGTTDIEHTRTVRIEKARNGKGTGCRLAFEFSVESLTLQELGLIVKT